jgi:hypothetical protein
MSGGDSDGRRKGKPDIAPVMRAAGLTAIKRVEQKEGKTRPALMADWLLKGPRAMVNTISKFALREQRVPAAYDHP